MTHVAMSVCRFADGDAFKFVVKPKRLIETREHCKPAADYNLGHQGWAGFSCPRLAVAETSNASGWTSSKIRVVVDVIYKQIHTTSTADCIRRRSQQGYLPWYAMRCLVKL